MPERFIPAATLKQQYHCLGHFYKLVLDNGHEIPCRSVLEILKTEKYSIQVRNEIADSFSDALVIMMNPGSSRPISSVHKDARIPAETISKKDLSRPLVPTVPDTTQYQVMRLMIDQNWDHVRVVNLSDLRNPNSVNFLQAASRLEKMPGGSVHSLFSTARRKERNLRLSMNRGPVIAGWGQSPQLTELAKRCVHSIGRERITGIHKPDRPFSFAHPSPRNHSLKLQWLTDMKFLLSNEFSSC